MGSYTDRLYKNRKAKKTARVRPDLYVQSCAIRRGDAVHSGFKSHAELRRSLGDAKPYQSTPGDDEGFLLSDLTFASRWEARRIGAIAGQCAYVTAPLLSSDITVWY